MFNSLSGEITYKDEERIFLSSGAIEWEIFVSRSSSDDLPEEGQNTKVFVYLYHRDDQVRLYGFSQSLERDVFLDLLKVEGVGPRQALRILSGVEVSRFIEALEGEDLELLSTIPGVGKKTAQKIMLKLKGKLQVSTPAGISLEEDIVNALVGMGFDRRGAKSAVGAAARGLRDSELNAEELERELFKNALSQLSGGSQAPAGAAETGSSRASEPRAGGAS
ncbi:MAG: Holliday junction branch migration protein RuvA [Spirochaetaceae bacterium]|nr:MAG: Holliday junction branch migration protein RuvA [Spirochaetaceae bacterium]